MASATREKSGIIHSVLVYQEDDELTLSLPRRVQLTLSKIRRAARELLTLEGLSPPPPPLFEDLYFLYIFDESWC
jgi:hypothetical protein